MKTELKDKKIAKLEELVDHYDNRPEQSFFDMRFERWAIKREELRRELADLSEQKLKEGLCYGPDCEGCRNAYHDICFKSHLSEQPDTPTVRDELIGLFRKLNLTYKFNNNPIGVSDSYYSPLINQINEHLK